MRSTLHSLWVEPRAADPPERVWRDWVLVVVLIPAVILEGIFRDDLMWRPVVVILGAGLVLTLLWRRTHPLAVVAVTFGALAVFNVVSLFDSTERVDPYSTAFVLVLVYSLFRWGAGREIVVGLGIILSGLVLSLVSAFTGIGDAVGGTIVLLFPAVLGVSIRYRVTARRQQLDQVKLQEREQLARELHDTVAHHVSAIAIQAQAGRFLAKSASLDGATHALEVIEEEASRALGEMRTMVGVLRDADTTPEMAPQRRVGDIEGLATGAGTGSPRVIVELSGDLDNLRPSVEAAMYRLAQESVTNAVRHARNATRVDVRVQGDVDAVRLTVNDNGSSSQAGSPASGYGIVGMTERVTLLGGTLEAGPRPNTGWAVVAVLPREEKGT